MTGTPPVVMGVLPVPAKAVVKGKDEIPPVPATRSFDSSKPVSDGNVPPPSTPKIPKGVIKPKGKEKTKDEPPKTEKPAPEAKKNPETPPAQPAHPEQPKETPEKKEKPEPEGTIRFDLDPYEKNTERKERALIREMTQTQFKDHLRRMFEAHCAQSIRGTSRNGESAMVGGSLGDLLTPERLNTTLDMIAREIYVESDEFQRGTVNYYQAYQKAWQIFVEELHTFRDTDLEGSLRDHPIFKSGAFEQRDAPGIYHDGVLVALPSNLRTGAGYHETARLRTKEGRDNRYGITREKPAYQYVVTDPRTGARRTITSKEMKTWRDSHTIVQPPSTVNDRPNSIQALVDARNRTNFVREVATELNITGRNGRAVSSGALEKQVTFEDAVPGDARFGIAQILRFRAKPVYHEGKPVIPERTGIIRIDKNPDDKSKSRVVLLEYGRLKKVVDELRTEQYKPLLQDKALFTPGEAGFINGGLPEKFGDLTYFNDERAWKVCRSGGKIENVRNTLNALNDVTVPVNGETLQRYLATLDDKKPRDRAIKFQELKDKIESLGPNKSIGQAILNCYARKSGYTSFAALVAKKGVRIRP